jgi:peptidoglycan/xylan/chitin deacetylase (PgdA/CDA1 family)
MTTVTLSFDNGPDRSVTPLVLDTLAERGILATFFVVGLRAAEPGAMALVERAHAAGHWIGNHTWTHSVPLGRRPEPDIAETEIARTQRLIAPFSCHPPLFRPFGGGGILNPDLLSGGVLDHLCAERFTCVLWNAVPRDWVDPDGWVATALAQIEAQPWSLVVLHDLPTGAMRHLPAFLDTLAGRGCEIRQDFPPDCLPIVGGTVVRPIDGFVTRH